MISILPYYYAADAGVRKLNLAGGEPLLYPDYSAALLRRAKALGMFTSVITNGARATPAWLESTAGILDVFGVSVDSFQHTANVASGRATAAGATLEYSHLLRLRDACAASGTGALPSCGPTAQPNNISRYCYIILPARGATAHPMPATSRPTHAHVGTVHVSVPFSPGQSRIPTVTAEWPGCRCLAAPPPVDLLRLDARRNCRRKHPDALADQTRAVAGDPV